MYIPLQFFFIRYTYKVLKNSFVNYTPHPGDRISVQYLRCLKYCTLMRSPGCGVYILTISILRIFYSQLVLCVFAQHDVFSPHLFYFILPILISSQIILYHVVRLHHIPSTISHHLFSYNIYYIISYHFIFTLRKLFHKFSLTPPPFIMMQARNLLFI